jgi:peroxiredoxin
MMRAGDVVELASFHDAVNKREVKIPSAPFNFVLYFNKVNFKDLQKVEYADYLAKHDSLGKVAFYVVTAGTSKELREMRASDAISIPLLEDSSYLISQRLRVSNNRNASFVVDRTGRILFSTSSVLLPEDIRELYEQYTYGKINYDDPSASQLQTTGSHFPDLRVTEVSSGKEFDLKSLSNSGKGSLYWVFAADCPVCSLSGVLSQLSDPSVPQSIIPIFSSRLPVTVLREEAQTSHITHPLYIANSEITGFESLYFSHSRSSVTSFLVRTDAEGVVTRIDTIGPFDKLPLDNLRAFGGAK